MGNKDRGSRTHGKGSQKRHRGAGSRGGRGEAGNWKHEKFPLKKQGKYGFKRPESVQEEKAVLNVGQIDESIDVLVDDGVAEEEGEGYTIDLASLGVDKLLGSGQVYNELRLTVNEATDSAVNKVEEAGGAVNVESEAEEEE